MARHAKKAHHEEEMNESWLLPYSDLMTLLLAVFIVLYAVNRADPMTITELANRFRNLYGSGETIIVGSPTLGGTGGPSGTGVSSAPAESDDLIDIWQYFPLPPPSGEGDSTRQEQMDTFSEALKTYFAQNNLSDEIQISEQPNMLTLTLESDVLFPSGSAQLNAAQREIAKNVAAIIQETQRRGLQMQVQVYGHTDNRPINTPQYPSNWHLSLDRASQFLRAMIEGSDLDPRAFSAVGHGEMDPVATNDTADGQQKNRRVEVRFLFEESAIGNVDGLLRPGEPEEQ